MATHTITLTAAEETVFQKLLTLTGLTEAQAIDKFAKGGLAGQALQYIEDACKNKLAGMTIAEKLTFIG